MDNRAGKLMTERGFTLIELLVIIAVTGILATIVIFSLWGITDTASRSAAVSDMRTLLTEIETQDADREGDYPEEDELDEITAYNNIDEKAESIEYENDVSDGEYEGGFVLSAEFDFGEEGEEYLIISSARGFEDEKEGHFDD